MDVVSVTLDEVLTAAAVRAASLVPETSGYLALAIADASARLPHRIQDAMVTLTTEGTVKVARGADVVAPAESAAVLRDGLARLLAASVGSMPALAAAARPRDESPEGVDAYIHELEAALVPVNRAAARRALGRLARETARARDAGKLRRRRNKRPRSEAPPRHEEAAPRRSAPPPRHSAPAPEPFAAAQQVSTPSDVLHASASPPSGTDEIVAAHAQAVAEPARAQVFSREPAGPEGLAIDVEFSERPPVVEPAPTPLDFESRPLIDDAATIIDAQAAPRRSRRPILEEPPSGATLGTCRQSDVDDLLDRFAVSALSDPEVMRATRASLKRLAGLDPTPPPPSVAELQRIIETMPAPKAVRVERASAGRAAMTLPVESGRRMPWALVAVGLVIAGLLGHYLPSWLA